MTVYSAAAINLSHFILFLFFRFDLKLKVFCEAGFYGPDCSVFCKAADDETGHFNCDPVTGGKICKSGTASILPIQ